ncbi:S9 family peptidase [Sphingomonas sp. JC676]|uniref:alpha/beta hydrolase family protein n=1 Tax=Sphingomonas sp. JC676 TaxID=2768065 RepID=UPI001657BAF9|nr:S9 family peptidase [Sphingomonas sp. JC676]MBC9034074.1 S9 family peptidase [Sphingomonas sp. JC676]
MRIRVMAALCASLWSISVAQAQSTEAKLFGAREGIQDISLSPDGKRVAIIVPAGTHGTALLVSKPDGSGLKAILQLGGEPDKLTSCAWSTPTRLVCNLFMILDRRDDLVGMSRVIAIDDDGTHIKELTPPQGSDSLYEAYYGGGILDWLPDTNSSTVLMARYYVPEASVGKQLVAQRREGLGVDRVDTVTLKHTMVEAPRPTAGEFITDGHGEARIMGVQPVKSSGYAGKEVSYLFRKPGSREWLPLGKVKYTGYLSEGFNPYAVDRNLNVAYGFDDLAGRKALYKVALDGSMKKDLVFSRDDVDIDGLVRIGRQQRVVGVSFATDKRQVSFFDPELKALSASLSKALPGLPLVYFSDASVDEKTLLLFAGSDTDPGRYYLLDRTTKKMAEVSPVRPQLSGRPLATVKPITFKAADGTSIPGYLTLPPGSDGKNLPAIVMPHGGPTARDEWGFDWLSQFFASRGYAVLQPNYRGSSGFGERWFKQNGFKSWRTAIGDVNDGGRWLVAQGIAAPSKLSIVGWSYGGYAALQSSVLDSNLFKAVVAIAPVTDLATLRADMKESMGDSVADDFVNGGALLKEGSPAQNAEKIKAPVLIFHGDRDINVPIRQSRMMEGKIRGAGGKVEFIEYKGLDHQLDDSDVRAKMLDRIDTFLHSSMGF